jgi:tRNA1(Val) A37 N6-methylase TrmN6
LSAAEHKHSEAGAPQPGDFVQVLRPEGLLAAFAKKIQGRAATLVRTYTRAGSNEVTALVLFHKRSGRGKEFEHRMALKYLQKAPAA